MAPGIVQLAATSKPERDGSPSGVPRKGDPKLAKQQVKPQKVGCWKRAVACLCRCFSSCCGKSKSKVAPSGEARLVRVAPAGGQKTLESLEEDAVRDIRSKVIGGEGRMQDFSGKLVLWDYEGIGVALGLLPAAKSIPMIRKGSSPGELAVCNAVIKNYKTFAADCLDADNPKDKMTALKRELVYRTIQLKELTGGGQEQGIKKAPEYARALIDASNNFDGDDTRRITFLRYLLANDAVCREKILGAITAPQLNAILRELPPGDPTLFDEIRHELSPGKPEEA